MATQARHMVGGDRAAVWRGRWRSTVALCGKLLGVICCRRMTTDLDWRRRKGGGKQAAEDDGLFIA
jgi:hypothetical protein